MLLDAEEFPRDKPCGDGLTPRAIAELTALGLGGWLEGRARNRGLRAAGFDQLLYLPWPGGNLPDYGGAAPRLELDHAIRQVALDSGAQAIEGARAVDPRLLEVARAYRLGRRYSLGLDVARTQRDSTVPSSNYKRNTVLLSLNATL